MTLIEQALLDVSVSWQARSLYVFLLARRYERPIIGVIAKDTGLSPGRVSMLIGELMIKRWLTRQRGRGRNLSKVTYDFEYRGHPALRPHL